MGYKITEKKKIAPDEYDIWVQAPRIAKHASAGQFVIIIVDEEGERIPLTIAGMREDEEIRLIYQVVGSSTEKLSRLDTRDEIGNIAGPLGKPSELTRGKQTLVIGGGVGIAAIVPIIQALKASDNMVTVILGSRDADHMILKEEIESAADEVLIYTDDGSLGEKGRVTDAMMKLHKDGRDFDQAWAVGPTIMMKYCSLLAKDIDLPIWTSLNPIMIDGTGMCGGCRVKVRDEIKFACVDGPEFDGRFVDWKMLMQRQKQYKKEERQSHDHCRLNLD